MSNEKPEPKRPVNSFFTDFKKFAVRGNALELAVGVIIGTAFGKIVSSLVSDIITPLLSIIVGNVDFTNHFFALNGHHYASVASARAANAPIVTYGNFVQNIVDFLVMSIVIFIAIRLLSRLARKEETTKEPSLTRDQKLLTEIRDLLKRKPQ